MQESTSICYSVQHTNKNNGISIDEYITMLERFKKELGGDTIVHIEDFGQGNHPSSKLPHSANSTHHVKNIKLVIYGQEKCKKLNNK